MRRYQCPARRVVAPLIASSHLQLSSTLQRRRAGTRTPRSRVGSQVMPTCSSLHYSSELTLKIQLVALVWLDLVATLRALIVTRATPLVGPRGAAVVALIVIDDAARLA